MADNIQLNLGSGGDILAADDISSVKYQRFKLIIGQDGTNSGDVYSGNPLPVLCTNAGTFAVQSASTLQAGSALVGKFGIDQTTPGTTNAVSVTNATLAVTQSGTWNVGTVTPGTGATNLGKAIDTATGSTDTGVLCLATRTDALTTLVPVDGDNTQLRVNADGALWCQITGTVTVGGTVTATGTISAVQSGTWNIGSITTLPALATGSNVIGAVTQSGTWNIGTVTTLTTCTTVTTLSQFAGNTINLGNGAVGTGTLRVTLATDSTGQVALATGANVIGAVTQSGTWNVGSITTLPALVAGTALIGKVGIDQTTPGTTNAVAVKILQGAATIAAGQYSVTTTSGAVVASRATRRKVTIVNHGTTDVYLGAGTVTTANGILLVGIKGAAVTFDTVAAVNGIVGSGTQTVSYIEEYD